MDNKMDFDFMGVLNKILTPTPHNKAVAGKCELETMNKKLAIFVNGNEAPEIANASYGKR